MRGIGRIASSLMTGEVDPCLELGGGLATHVPRTPGLTDKLCCKKSPTKTESKSDARPHSPMKTVARLTHKPVYISA